MILDLMESLLLLLFKIQNSLVIHLQLILEHLQVIQQIDLHHYLIIEERDLTILISSIDLKKHRDILQENKMGFIT